jgi:Cytochrome c
VSAWRALAAVYLLLGPGASLCRAAGDSAAIEGESIYRRGVLGSGAPLEATRVGGGLATQGAEAACVNCHRHSGLGSTEGNILIPPVTGRYLFQPRNLKHDELELPYLENAHANRDPYTDVTLARAIRDGLDSAGKPFSYLMPRFVLKDADMAALIHYLKSLDTRTVPGVTPTVLHFATIITPDADPVKRRGMLDVMQHYFADKNTFPLPPSPRMRSSGKTLYAKSMYHANRHWQLHVWELSGPAATWTAQLQRHLAEEPVLAAVSGLAGSNWVPVHEFCEHEALPCVFPNVEVPIVADRDFYSLYFSKGVLLEAQLIAKKIIEPGEGLPAKVVQQIYRAGDSGAPAAQALAETLQRHGVVVRSEVLGAGAQGRGVGEALHKAAAADALVLWLRPADIAALGAAPAAPVPVFMSGLMGGLENSPLPPSWRSRTRLAYPFDLPEHSTVRLEYPLRWFAIRRIPIVAEQVQIDTYLACGLLAETVSQMADNFVRDYLVERMEEMLEHRVMTGDYPRLALAEGQRFASKGGYVVRLTGAQGSRVSADGNWMVP